MSDSQNELSTGGTDRSGELLKDLFSHSMRHPANYTDWRCTLIVFARAVGADKETLKEAHKAARDEADQQLAVDELGEALGQAEQYIEELPLPDGEDR